MEDLNNKKEKIIGINIKEDTREVILTYEDKKQKRFKMGDTDLNLALMDRREELEDRLKVVNEKTKKYKFWKNMLSASGGLFLASFIYIIVAVLAVSNPSLIALLTLLPLGISYYKYVNYLNDEEQNIKLEDKIIKQLEKIDYIEDLQDQLEKGITPQMIVQDNSLKQEVKSNLEQSKDKSSSHIDVDIRLISDLMTNAKKNGKSLALQIFNIKRQFVKLREETEFSQTVIQSNLNTSSRIFQRALAVGDTTENLRRENDARMDALDRSIENFNRRGNRR